MVKKSITVRLEPELIEAIDKAGMGQTEAITKALTYFFENCPDVKAYKAYSGEFVRRDELQNVLHECLKTELMELLKDQDVRRTVLQNVRQEESVSQDVRHEALEDKKQIQDADEIGGKVQEIQEKEEKKDGLNSFF